MFSFCYIFGATIDFVIAFRCGSLAFFAFPYDAHCTGRSQMISMDSAGTMYILLLRLRNTRIGIQQKQQEDEQQTTCVVSSR